MARNRKSAYADAWDVLKHSADNTLTFRLSADVNLPLDKKKKLFLRVRKAISTRKLLDTEYMRTNPTSKLEVVAQDWDNMRFTFRIKFCCAPLVAVDLNDLILEL